MVMSDYYHLIHFKRYNLLNFQIHPKHCQQYYKHFYSLCTKMPDGQPEQPRAAGAAVAAGAYRLPGG